MRNRRNYASHTRVRVRAWIGAERVLHVARKLVPNYSDFLINVSADDDGACGSSFLSLFFPLPRTYAQLESAAIPDCAHELGDVDRERCLWIIRFRDAPQR